MLSNTSTDLAFRFLFEEADVRGEAVTLHHSLQDILDAQPYGHTVRQLLSEFAASVVLISNNLKYDGKITLQGRSDGPLSLIVAECSSEGQLRGIARGDLSSSLEGLDDLLPEGIITLTIDPTDGKRYQGIVACQKPSLAEVLSDYFSQSEQLSTQFWLATKQTAASALMLQQLPAPKEQALMDDVEFVCDQTQRDDDWETLCTLANTVTANELLELDIDQLLGRLFAEWSVSRFEPKPIQFNCSCSRERSLAALTLLPDNEITELFEEQKEVTMNCEMCGQSYVFAQTDLKPEGNHTLH